MARLAHAADDDPALHRKDHVDGTREIAVQRRAQGPDRVRSMPEHATGGGQITLERQRGLARLDLGARHGNSLIVVSRQGLAALSRPETVSNSSTTRKSCQV